MPDEKTAISEVVTALAACGSTSVDVALAARPSELLGVDTATWRQLSEAWLSGRHAALFDLAWSNGAHLLAAKDGLRHRRPVVVEWKGPHKPPGYETLPADLRIDHVYLISCKYGSDISANYSPSNVFDRLLADRSHRSEPWYGVVAADAYRAFYAEVRTSVGGDLPHDVAQLAADDIRRIRAACERRWPDSLVDPWRQFSFQVAAASAARWRANLPTVGSRELMLWRLLRLETSPYFVLGSLRSGEPVRYRVATPWDWRQRFRLRSFSVTAVVAGQPLVRWTAEVDDRSRDERVVVEGEIEIRWSHGRFSAVEAKLHLRTAPNSVPGYFPLG